AGCARASGRRTRGRSGWCAAAAGWASRSSTGSSASTPTTTGATRRSRSGSGRAAMCIDGMAAGDLAVNVALPKPWDWPEFYSYADNNFVLRDDSWNPAGKGAPGNGSLPYGKVMHAAYVLTYFIRNEHIPQWHSRED